MISKGKSWKFGQEEARCKSLDECEWVEEENGNKGKEKAAKFLKKKWGNMGFLPS